CNPLPATPAGLARVGFGLFPFRSPLLGESRLISSPLGTEMFHFPRFPALAYGFSEDCQGMTPGGFPHSDIPGSTPACGSPRRIGACPVLLRLLAPRHPPCALLRLTCRHRPFRCGRHQHALSGMSRLLLPCAVVKVPPSPGLVPGNYTA